MERSIYKALESFGFSQAEIEIYILLGKVGPLRAADMAIKVEVSKQQIYSRLKDLKQHKAVYRIRDCQAKYYALPLAQILDLYANLKIDEAQTIQKNKEKLLKQWQIMTKLKKA